MRSTVIAVDTNLLVYAHRPESPFHQAAREKLEVLAARRTQWAIPWPCAHEFIAIVTNPRIYKSPTPLEVAMQVIREFSALANVTFLSESDGYLERLEAISVKAKVRGATIHDARIAALCLHHGVSELWSADRDFMKFPALISRNPLTD